MVIVWLKLMDNLRLNKIKSGRPKNKKNIISAGQKFGRLTITSFVGYKNGKDVWSVKCDCGKNKKVLRASIIRGTTTSCGCVRRELLSKKATVHGLSKTRIYKIWVGMVKRCNNKNNKSYSYYGGRGITVCKRWRTFINFYDDMFDEYKKHIIAYGRKNTTIDRINNDLGYSKKNCRWATRLEQRLNQGTKI